MPPIERHYRIGAAIYRRFQHHLITGIQQLRPPLLMDLDRLDDIDDRIDQVRDVGLTRLCREHMFGARGGCFIFQRKCDAQQHGGSTLQQEDK
jgi:hypothetical protein